MFCYLEEKAPVPVLIEMIVMLRNDCAEEKVVVAGGGESD